MVGLWGQSGWDGDAGEGAAVLDLLAVLRQ